MFEVSKVKSYVRVTRDDGKFYQIDINTAEIVGLRGKPIANLPHDVIACICDTAMSAEDISVSIPCRVIKHFRQEWYPQRVAQYLAFYDKVVALNPQYFHVSWAGLSFEPEILLIPFKKIARAIKEQEQTEQYYTINEIVRSIQKEERLKEVRKYSEEYAEILYHLSTYGEMSDQHYRIAVHYLNQGLAELVGIHEAASILRKFFRWCREMDYKPQKQNFLKEYAELQKNYEIWRVEKANSRIADRQPDNLFFENDLFFTVIPKTVEELVKEGNTQRNCVGSYGDRIAEGACNVVFIRSKQEPTKSLVTCDMSHRTYWGESDSEYLIIGQYLKKCNSYVDETKDADLLQFKEAYQEYLKTLV